MSVVVFPDPKRGLTSERFTFVIETIRDRLRGRVREAFVFGSAGTHRMTRDSDVDLILVVDELEAGPFVHRPLNFTDLYDVYPALDLLVYTPKELAAQLADSKTGFWKSARESMRQII